MRGWICLLFALGCAPARAPCATFQSDAPAVMQRNGNGLVLRKTLDAYKTFGCYDVAYTSQMARWTFEVPEAKILSATLVLSMSADDHATAIRQYRYRVRAGEDTYGTPSELHHGLPMNAPFDNWTDVTVPARVASGETFVVTLFNDAYAEPLDWIAVKWIELRLDIEG